MAMLTDSSESTHIEKHLLITASDKTAVEHLFDCTPLSKQKIKQAMTNGCVWLESPIGTHRLRRSKKRLAPETTLHLYYDAAIQNTSTEEAVLIADLGEYSIWNKPYGMYSQGSKWGDHCTLYRWADTHLTPERPSFTVHRLDRAASGLMILAHSKKMAKAFSELFKNRHIHKQYKAVVEGTLESLTMPYTISADIDERPAISRILSLEPNKNNTLITIEIETGRKHQVRKHLSGLGYPIVGDRLYGTKSSEENLQPLPNLQLQSCYLKFNCPLTDTVREYSL